MGHSRRTFIRNSALAVSTAGFLPRMLASPSKKEIVGIQLYTVREAMAKDPSGSLKQLADMGYRYVEHANYVNGKFYGYAPKEFKNLLDGLGLKMISGHTPLGPGSWDEAKNDFSDTWKKTVEDAATAGQKFVISQWIDESMRKNYDDLMRLLEKFNKSGQLCKAHGMKFGYHNHDFEFSTVLNNQKIFDIIMQHTDPELVAQQLDMGNLYNGGAIAIAIVMQYPGRFELMHVKDEIKAEPESNKPGARGSSGEAAPNKPGGGEREKYESTILGEGIVSTKQVCDTGRKNGTRYFIVEQEAYQGKDPFECSKADLAVMKKWGY